MEESIAKQDDTIQYRPWVHKLFYFSIFAILVAELIIYRLHYQKFESAGLVFGSFQFLVASSVPLGILLRLLIVVRPRIFSKFELHQDKLIILLGKKKSEIQFSQINEIKKTFLPPKFLGGFQIILNSGKKLYFSSIIKNEEKLIEAIHSHSPALIDTEKNKNLLLEVIETDRYWSHVYKRLRSPYYLFYRILLVPAGICLVLELALSQVPETQRSELALHWNTNSLNFFVICLLLNLVLGIFASHLADKLLLSFKRNSADEKLLEKYYSLSAEVAYLSSLVLLLFLLLQI